MNERIFGGQTSNDIIPWQVWLKSGESEEDVPVWFCGGTIICPRFILTAWSECINTLAFMFGQGPTVIVQDHDWTDEISSSNEYEVKRAIWHPNYTTYEADENGTVLEWRDFNFALLELYKPIPLDARSRARAACLPRPTDNFAFNEETRFVVSGWGHIDGYGYHGYGTVQDKLKVATVEYCTSDPGPAYCKGCPQNDQAGKERKICTRADKGVGPCLRDNGGKI